MTMALCFSCGNVKWGAIVACDECGVNSTGDMSLDILFSDHNMAEATLEQFGQVVKLINRHVEDRNVRFWTFLSYVALHHELMKVTPPEDIAEQVNSLCSKLEFPPVQIMPSWRSARAAKPS